MFRRRGAPGDRGHKSRRDPELFLRVDPCHHLLLPALRDSGFGLCHTGKVISHRRVYKGGAGGFRKGEELVHGRFLVGVGINCCIPFGIPAIVFAARVKAFLLNGQYAMAQEASEKAKMWCWVGFLIGIVIGGIYLLFGLSGALLEGL